MPKHEFGIIDKISNDSHIYENYEPAKYYCISVDDDYIEPLLLELKEIDTFFHNISRPEKGLAYFGITLIPPVSFPKLKEILMSKNIDVYKELIKVIDKAVSENKYMIVTQKVSLYRN